MDFDAEYLHGVGLGLQSLRVSGQFCDTMVCVGSTRILAHKVVLSAASKVFNDLALEFDMTPHGERDQLEIIIPSDISLYAVNMFINYIYTGQLNINERIVGHLQRLASTFAVTTLETKCQEFIQRTTAPDSQNLNLKEEQMIIIEPDSSCANGAQSHNEELSFDERSRSSSSCSGVDQTFGQFRPGLVSNKPGPSSSKKYLVKPPTTPPKKPVSDLEKLMSPVVNLTKLPSNITPDVVVLVSDDENEDSKSASGKQLQGDSQGYQFSLQEKEAIAIEAKRFGTTQVAKSRNIPLQDILSWMSLFGLRHQANKQGQQVNHEADLAVVRWIAQQQEVNGYVDLSNLKKYALTVYLPSQPKFSASKSWLGNFLQRNVSVLQGTHFVRGVDESGERNLSVKQEILTVDDVMNENRDTDSENLLGELGQSNFLDNVSLSEQMQLNDSVLGLYNTDDAGDDDDFEDVSFADVNDSLDSIQSASDGHDSRVAGSIMTPFGKKPIIIGQAKCFDAKSERKIVHWVLERNARDGYVFTDDFKDYARSLYQGSKPFGATQAWMKKFLRRNRVLKDVKFCSKFKNTYTAEEKLAAVAMARRFGSSYASKHTGISHKMIHCWKLQMDRGQMNAPVSMMEPSLSGPQPSTSSTATLRNLLEKPPILQSISNMSSSSSSSSIKAPPGEAVHGIVPEFEQRIVEQIKELNATEGSVNYDEISQISQSIYKETRPTFKASYNWIRSFMDRHREALREIELENVSKVVLEDESPKPSHGLYSNSEGSFSNEKISQMVDNALKEIDQTGEGSQDSNDMIMSQAASLFNKDRRPVVVGPSVTFTRKTEKQLVEWVLEKQASDGYVFTDDFKEFAKSVHSGPKHFSASSGWLTLFLRRHRDLRDVKWKSKFKNNYSEDEKRAAVAEAKRLGAGHVGRQLGIDPALICAWKIKLDKTAPKLHTFWKGTKIRKFGKGLKNFQPKFNPKPPTETDASRGIVPEFEQRIVEMIMEEHEKEGSISYEEMSSISQSVYKETRPTFKASYAWIRSFMKRHEQALVNLNIDNVKKVFYEDDPERLCELQSGASPAASGLNSLLNTKRPIIIGQSRTLDTKTEKKLVEWLCNEQAKNGYVFLSKFKEYAQSLYSGEKKFAATQAWRIKFIRRNYNAVKHIKFTSSFRNQYSVEEKLAIVQEAKRHGTAHVAKQTGIDHCLVNAWRLKLERDGLLPKDDQSGGPKSSVFQSLPMPRSDMAQSAFLGKLKPSTDKGPGLFSVRGVVPVFEKKIVSMVNDHMDREGSVSYQDVSNIARAVYKETRPNFKACYKWIKKFIDRNKKEFKHVEFEVTKIKVEDDNGFEVFIAEDKFHDMDTLLQETATEAEAGNWDSFPEGTSGAKDRDPMVFIDNAEDPNYEAQHFAKAAPGSSDAAGVNIQELVARKPVIAGTPLHFNRKTEKQMVVWLYERQDRDGFVFTDDFRDYARSLYVGPPGKFGATNAWINKFLRRNNMQNRISFQSRLKGNNPKYEEKILELILEQQDKEGSVSHDDIQKITQSVYKDIRPNFRACYNWIRDFLKRHKDELKGVDLENVKKVFIPDDDEKDGVLISDIDHMKGFPFADTSADFNDSDVYLGEDSHDSSWVDMDSSDSQINPMPGTSQSSGILNLLKQKRPVIIAPPKSLDTKTEKKLVQWMVEQQKEQGCVYLDLFKDYARSIYTGQKKFAATQAWMIKFKQRNHEALKDLVIRSRFRNEYSAEEKLAAVEEARRLGCHHVGRKLGINGSVIYSWKVQLEQQERLGMSPAPLTEVKNIESQRGMVPEFEQTIVEMTLEKQAEKGSVSYEDVSQIARMVYQETRPNFKASYNWVVDFIRKYTAEFEHVSFENQRKVNTEEEKLQILSEEKKYGTDHVVKKRNISASTIYHWKKAMQAKSIPIPKYKALVGSKIKKKYAKGKRTYKVYTVEEKRKVVSEAEKNGITYASLKLGISRNMIAKWVKYFRDQGENIVINFTHGSTMKKELEQKVISWVLQQNEELGIVLTSLLKEFAQKVFQEAFTLYNASDSWLSTFISTNGEKFSNVRFREKGDMDLDFTDEIKLKLSRYAEKHGANKTALQSGVSPKNIYHWRRVMKNKGYALDVDTVSVKEEMSEPVSPQPVQAKSLMQQKLDRIDQRYNQQERESIVRQALNEGTSVTATWHKIPLPLLLNWMKLTEESSSQGMGPQSASGSKSNTPEPSNILTVKLPGIEKMKSSPCRYTEDFKKQLLSEAKVLGCTDTSRKYGIPNSTLYTWIRDAGYDSAAFESQFRKKSVEPSDSARSSVSRDSERLPTFNIANVKKEPGLPDTPSSRPSSSLSSPNLSSPVDNSPIGSYGKVVRKYTEDEKLNVVKKALQVGVKAASVEMDIHVSNVRRWTNLYKKKVQSKESRDRVAARRASGEMLSPGVKQMSSPDMKPFNFTPKRKLADDSMSYESELKRKRKISSSYSDDDRIGFVQDSEVIGTRQAAQKAGVSLDVLYKWRQKYLRAARMRAANPVVKKEIQSEQYDSQAPHMEHKPDVRLFPSREEMEDDNSSSGGDSDGYEDIEDFHVDELEDFSHSLHAKSEDRESAFLGTNEDSEILSLNDIEDSHSSQALDMTHNFMDIGHPDEDSGEQQPEADVQGMDQSEHGEAMLTKEMEESPTGFSPVEDNIVNYAESNFSGNAGVNFDDIDEDDRQEPNLASGNQEDLSSSAVDADINKPVDDSADTNKGEGIDTSADMDEGLGVSANINEGIAASADVSVGADVVPDMTERVDGRVDMNEGVSVNVDTNKQVDDNADMNAGASVNVDTNEQVDDNAGVDVNADINVGTVEDPSSDMTNNLGIQILNVKSGVETDSG